MNIKKKKTGLDLLADIAKLIKKHGIDEFEALIEKLEDKDFVSNLSNTLKILSKSSRNNNQQKRKNIKQNEYDNLEQKNELADWREVISKNREQVNKNTNID